MSLGGLLLLSLSHLNLIQQHLSVRVYLAVWRWVHGLLLVSCHVEYPVSLSCNERIKFGLLLSRLLNLHSFLGVWFYVV